MAMANSTAILRTGHEDLIHDVEYDFYGRRLATCSSDQRIKVFDMQGDSGEWEENDTWKAHDANIVKVIWAHPEHGQIIASCSVDRSVRVFEEQDSEALRSGKRWAEKARLVESLGAIHAIAFAPNHLGLKLASVSSDATVRVYEAMLPQNLSQWTLIEDFQVLPAPPPRETEAAFCVSWCPSRFGPSQLVVGAMETVKIYRPNAAGKWKPTESLDGHKGIVRDIAWAPSAGRSYHLIATACEDGHLRIFKLVEAKSASLIRRDSNFDVNEDERDGEHPHALSVECIADFDDHQAEVWKVSWNVTGTLLNSSGDDGKVRLWKPTYAGKFQCMSVINAERPRDEDAIED